LIEGLIQRSEQGEPLPYILGHWEFFGLDFDLTSDVLIPRPETEVLVERALAWLQASPLRRTVADIGSGSGCIAIALASNIPDAQILATDISPRALEVARGNAAKHKVTDRIDFLECDVLPVRPDPLPTEDHFDLICANLPYIPTEKLMALPIYGREPTVALDGGRDGLDIFRKLLGLSPKWLAPGGRILLEIEATLGRAALSLAYDTFNEAELHLHKDLAGQNRLLEIQLPLL
jgi:release factor glutamine methyltransferase